MTFLGDLRDGVDRLARFAELDCEVSGLVAGAGCLSDSSVRDAFAAVAGLSREVQKLEVVLAGVIARRSARSAGHGGLAQTEGFRTPVQMVQEITGVPRGEAIRVVRVGETLTEGAVAQGPDASSPDGPTDLFGGDASAGADERGPWHQPLGEALLAGAVTRAQVDVIRRGLGEPPALDGRVDDDVVDVWRVAAGQLIDEAARCTIEDLAASARAVRDAIDPAGAEARWVQHYEARSFRMRVDADGRRHGHIVFDDLTAAFWQSVMDAALRPRRGGPRFMTDQERAAATDLAEDPRTNEQLAYDLVADMFRAGTTAEAKDVFGTRQAGVRLVTVQEGVGDGDADGDGVGDGDGGGAGDAAGAGGGAAEGGAVRRDLFGRLLAVAHTEDGEVTIPGSVLERTLCETGTISVTLDSCGNPLDVGREHRLFTPAQRIALAARDGGCMWPGCDRPPSYCEAHHIDEWVADEGRTDIARGILLCFYHHVHVHMTGMKITRNGLGLFRLTFPPGDARAPIELASKSPLRWMFDPPPRTPWRLAA